MTDSLDALADILDALDHDDVFDAVEAHGLCTALAVGPEPVLASEWLETLTGECPLSATQRDSIIASGTQLIRDIDSALACGEQPELPFDTQVGPKELDDSDIAAWCTGFLAGMLLREEAWHEVDEQQVAELLMPLLVLSGYIDDPEISRQRSQAKSVLSFARAVPGCVEDLYLFFHEQTHE